MRSRSRRYEKQQVESRSDFRGICGLCRSPACFLRKKGRDGKNAFSFIFGQAGLLKPDSHEFLGQSIICLLKNLSAVLIVFIKQPDAETGFDVMIQRSAVIVTEAFASPSDQTGGIPSAELRKLLFHHGKSVFFKIKF